MSEQQTVAPHAGADGLWRWLVGGLVGGALILGLLIAAYAVGYHNGRHHLHAAASAPAPTTTTSPGTSTQSSAVGPIPSTPALVARGKSLYTADGCTACHSLTGSSGVGPSLKGVSGSQVALADGTTVTADDAYLVQSITSPDAQIVKGYRAGIMPAAVASFGFAAKPNDVRALVAYIKAQQ